MKKIFLALMVVLATSSTVMAGSLKVTVGEFTVTGASNRDELKTALPALLSSRLSGDGIAIVDSSADADLQLLGSYTAFGAMFSIDAALKSPAGETVGRSFVQGQGADDLIPAVGRLAEQMRPVIKGIKPRAEAQAEPKAVQPVAVPLPVPIEKQAVAASTPALANAPAVTGNVVTEPYGDIIRSAPAVAPVTKQQRIEGEYRGITPVRVTSDGEREFVLADEKKVYLYRQGEGLLKIHEYELKGERKIIALDSADADGDGQLEVYVTVMDREQLVSVVLAAGDKGFAPVAEKLPYYFRAIAVAGKDKQLFAQQIGGSGEDYYGDVRRVVKKGNSFSPGEPLKLPKLANIYNFNQVTAADGTTRTVLLDEDGNLRVYDESGQELWKGFDRFGGSDVYFLRDEQEKMPHAISRYRWRFLEQRISVTPNGEIIVPRNSGTFVHGNNRSYSKSLLFSFAWNGASLEERWHTKEDQSYLADYYYDAARKELVLLQQVQKGGLMNKGASTVVIKKVE